MTVVPTGHDETIVEVWVNCPDEQTAATIADLVVDERLAACANIYPSISSRYHWKGKIKRAREVPLLLKTRQSLFDMLVERVTVLHPYETPSIVGIEVIQASAAYRAWLVDSTDQ